MTDILSTTVVNKASLVLKVKGLISVQGAKKIMSNWTGLHVGKIISWASGFCLSLADRQVHIQVLHKTLWACKDYFMGLVVGMPLGRLHHSYTLLKLQDRKLVFLTYMPWC